MLQGVLDPVSNRATWQKTVTVQDSGGTAVDLTGGTIVVDVREQRRAGFALPGYTGEQIISPPITLEATIANGKITFPSGNPALGIFQWTFSVTDMRTLCAATYDVGITFTSAGGVTTQLFVGTVAVYDGIVQ